MWRYIVDLLATLGFLTLLAAGAAVVLVSSAPFAPKPLPSPIVLSLDLRQVPPEATRTDLLRGLLQTSRDIVDTIELLTRATDDPRVVGLFVDIGDTGAGLGRVQELRQALSRFRSHGKFAVGFARSLGGNANHFADYYLASALDQIWLQPSGRFSVAGIAVETPFLKTGLERLGVQVEGGRRQEYKSAADIFTETGFTAPARENLQQLLDSLYAQFIDDAAGERRLAPERLRELIDAVPFDAERALREGLVDRVGYRTDALDEVWRQVGAEHDLVSLADYAADDSRPRASGDLVALVRIAGPIVSGTGRDSPFDDDVLSTAEEIVDALDAAARAKQVRAIVLRIDSPGGTYPAADAIADGVARARGTGMPVIVSMGDVAASGGYLAAVRADAIVAQPATITGSIGVFGVWPVAADLLASLGVNVERVAVGANAGMYSVFRAPTPAQRTALARELDAIYADFTRQVGEARKLDDGRLDAAARGRVFSGADAKRAGLIDELGGLPAAIDVAKAKAGIAGARPVELRRFPEEGGRLRRLVERLIGVSAGEGIGPQLRAPREVRDALAQLGITARPGNVRLPPLPPLWR